MIKKITSLKDIRLQDILNTERLNRTIQNIQDSLKKWDEKLMKEAIIAGLKVQTRLGSKEAKKELKRYNIRDREKQIIRARRRQQLLRENQDRSNNWKRMHGLSATRKNGSKTKQSIAGTRQKGIETKKTLW